MGLPKDHWGRGPKINLHTFDAKEAFLESSATEASSATADRQYAPRVRVFFEKNSFIIKTADNLAELDEILKLRFEIFHCEFLGKPVTVGIDVDDYDRYADHLLIQDRKSGKIVGTYRLIASRFGERFYSTSEFNLDSFLAEDGIKLELSRACIHPNFRNGAVIHLLWRGIVDYIKQVEAAYLFGCSSVKSMDPGQVTAILGYLSELKLFEAESNIRPRAEYQFSPPLPAVPRLTIEQMEVVKETIPPLFQFYLRAGAKVYGEPALDRHLECTDFLTVLKIGQLRKSYERKYLPT